MNASLKLIETKREYLSVLNRFQSIFHAKAGTEEAKEAELLALIIENYETKNIQIPEPDPIEAIKFMMEQSNMNLTELSTLLGNKGNVSKVLNRKRKLSLEMIRNISKALHIPAEILIKDYTLSA